MFSGGNIFMADGAAQPRQPYPVSRLCCTIVLVTHPWSAIMRIVYRLKPTHFFRLVMFGVRFGALNDRMVAWKRSTMCNCTSYEFTEIGIAIFCAGSS